MTHPRFTDIGACVFDAYGTLFDVHSAAAHCRADLGDAADAVSRTWREPVGLGLSWRLWRQAFSVTPGFMTTIGPPPTNFSSNSLAKYLPLLHTSHSPDNQNLLSKKQGQN